MPKNTQPLERSNKGQPPGKKRAPDPPPLAAPAPQDFQKNARHTDLQIITWNIQRVNQTKCLEMGSPIKDHLKSATETEKPFFIAILENKSDPEDVQKLLREFPGDPPTQKTLRVDRTEMGGDTNIKENLVWVAGGGLEVVHHEEWTKWKDSFKVDTDAQVKSVRSRLEDPLNHPHMPLRKSTDQKVRNQISQIGHPEASHFRNPILLTLKMQGATSENFNILIVHAPGPGGKELSMETYAKTYMKAVFDAALKDKILLVQGDMNIHGEVNGEKEPEGYIRLGSTKDGTTLSHTGEAGPSQWDRAYILRGFANQAKMVVNRTHITRDVSDHLSIKCNIQIPNRAPMQDAAPVTDMGDSPATDATMPVDAPVTMQP